MTTPDHSPLPWTIETDEPCTIRDADGSAVAIVSSCMLPDANLIITAVNAYSEHAFNTEMLTRAHARLVSVEMINFDLLAAAKRIIANDSHGASDWEVIDDLQAAITAAEEQAP